MKRYSIPVTVLLGIWTVILLTPALRNLFLLQITGVHLTQKVSVLPPRELPDDFWKKASRRFPDDLYVQAQSVEYSNTVPLGSLYSYRTPNMKVLRGYDTLIEKHSDNIWLIARRLRLTIAHFRSDRLGGEFSDPNGLENFRASKASPERNPETKKNFTPEDLQRAIALCCRAQEMEPQNGFWDWLLTCFYLIDWRDVDAWRHLAQAARKNTFQGHELEDAQAANAAWEVALGRKLTWEETTEFALGDQLPTHSRWREFARIISWEGMKARRRGDNGKALNLWGNLARTANRIRLQNPYIVGTWVAVALENCIR